MLRRKYGEREKNKEKGKNGGRTWVEKKLKYYTNVTKVLNGA